VAVLPRPFSSERIVSLPVGNFPTFAAGQYNIPGAVTPSWYFNRREPYDLFAAHEYQQVYQGLHDRVYDLSNYPPDRRWERMTHLLFASSGPPGRG
jgi:hypothetical protein